MTDRQLASLKFVGASQQFRLHLDAIALAGNKNYSTVQLLSVAGPHTTIKALHACLAGGATVSYSIEGTGELDDWIIYPYGDGYRCYTHRLTLNTWHLLAIAKREGLIPVVNDTALFNILKSDKFTTPLLPSWTPWLAKHLHRKGMLEPLACWQCEAATLDATTENLDGLVSEGLAYHALKIA